MRTSAETFPEIAERMRVVRRMDRIRALVPGGRRLPARALAALTRLSFRAEALARRMLGGGDA